MVTVLLSWLVAGTAALVFGKTIVDRIYHNDLKTMGKVDIYLMTGIIFLNVYAQIFSLFDKVARVACMILLTAGGVLAARYLFICMRKRESLIHLGCLREHPCRLALILVGGGATVLWTLLVPRHYDTGLYHAQAIRWIEEYGIVPGLGNLHMRLAYNSAFMCLQALFSLKWLLGQSLHTLNGFFCVFMIGYVIMTVHAGREQAWKISDMLKCATIVYIVLERDLISSPNSDLWAMLLVLYVCLKWCEFSETDQTAEAPWCFISLVGIYAVTVKLSTTMVVLLTVYPLYLLLRKRDVKQLLGNIGVAILIVLPFLVRNVILSGYLVYPYAGIDLFHVDWKMLKGDLESDRLLIKIFGRGFQSEQDYDDSMFGWIPHWFSKQELRYQILTLAGVVCTVILLCWLFRYIREKKLREAVFTGTVLISLMFWFIAAPLPRYGAVYLMIVTAIAVGGICGKLSTGGMKRLVSAGVILVMTPLLLLYVYVAKLATPSDIERLDWLRQTEYRDWPASQYSVDGAMIWVPDEGDRIGYSAFPSAPLKEKLDGLHLRGDSLKEGFYKELFLGEKMKDE